MFERIRMLNCGRAKPGSRMWVAKNCESPNSLPGAAHDRSPKLHAPLDESADENASLGGRGDRGHPRTEWLSLQAAWQLKYSHDGNQGRELLKRLVREFPGTGPGFCRRTAIAEICAAPRMSSQKISP